MGRWDHIKQNAFLANENVRELRKLNLNYVGGSPSIIIGADEAMALVEEAEKEECCSHPSDFVVFDQHYSCYFCKKCHTYMTAKITARIDPKPRSVVEEIWEKITELDNKTPWREEADRLRMALAEAVEMMEYCANYPDEQHDGRCKAYLKDMLAILKGEKTREMPNDPR